MKGDEEADGWLKRVMGGREGGREGGRGRERKGRVERGRDGMYGMQ